MGQLKDYFCRGLIEYENLAKFSPAGDIGYFPR
jgi:hypothetical protein